MDHITKARELVAQMTLTEKASLCSGENFWQTKGVERLGLPRVMVTDGPHGLRKQAGDADHLGIAQSVPATCFPAACATACTFDPALLTEMGRALGEECVQEEVAVILGPGVNIKRSPLCGRNFEYFSEDPLLGGELAAALINGVQEMGVGTSLKHYAANNQESRRMTIDAVVDERAMREIYLKSFEIPIRKAQPWTVMCSYNMIGGVYSSDNKWLLTDVLREDWGYEGLVVTDWGAMNDRVQAVLAGCDLEMPGTASSGNDAKIIAAVQDGRLNETDVDKLAVRIVEMVLQAQAGQQKGFRYDAEAHHSLARKIAAESCVLLKNDDDILPLKAGAKLAVIGGFAKTPRYQGAGSSKINPTRMDNALEELTKLGFSAVYADGYKGLVADDALIAEAVKTAQEAEIAVIFAGLPDEYESEGFDRQSLDMPESHTRLIRAVSEANPRTVVVLQLGAPVITDWAANIKGLLVTYLGGQAGGGGAADVLSGRVCPGGRLPESWPLNMEDNPSFHYFPGSKKTVEYRESIFVGYRYYETVGKPVAWPFGYGLSYTTFAYDKLVVAGNEMTFTVANTGVIAGAETAQVYVGLDESKITRPKKWLAAFEKVRLAPGESTTVRIKLPPETFKFYDAAASVWRVEGGVYTISVGASVSDIRLTGSKDIPGDGGAFTPPAQIKAYNHITGNTFDDADFAALYGKPLPPRERNPRDPFTVKDTLGDIKHTAIGAKIIEMASKQAADAFGTSEADTSKMVEVMLMDMPLRTIGMMGGGSVPPNFAELLLGTLNGNIFTKAAGTVKFILAMARLKKK
jgi:beta-glucosidase